MERLTQKSDKMIWFKDHGLKIEPCEMNTHHCRMILEKLADYEEAEEQSLIVRLPCKVGEKLWCIINSTIRELRVHHFDMPAFGTTDIVFRYADGFKLERFVGEIGKTVFLTREEAEKKLEEMKCE